MSRPPKAPVSRPGPQSGAPLQASAPAANPVLLNLARGLLCVALGVSAYLAFVSFTHGALAGCGPESDCDRVLQSRWSRWFGVPVSAFALVVDVSVLWATFALTSIAAPARRRAEIVASLGALLIVGAGIWFIALQFAGVGICPYCMTAHGAGVLGALLVLHTVHRRAPAAGLFERTAAGAALALAVLVLGQFVQKAPAGRESRIVLSPTNTPSLTPVTPTGATARVTSTASVAVATPTNSMPSNTVVAAVSNAPPSPATNEPPRRTFTPGMGPVSAMKAPFQFYEGMFAVDMAEVPLIGAPTNARVMLSLFDYCCHHCRAMHPILHDVQRACGDDLVIVSLPMPLDARCNRTLQRTPPAHTNACVFAHLGLAVWRADRAKHREFDDWLMTGSEAPPLPAALARAVSLIGSNALAKTLRDPWIERQVQFDVAVYEVAYRSGHGSMPQLVVGQTISEGTRTREDVFKMLSDSFGLKPRNPASHSLP